MTDDATNPAVIGPGRDGWWAFPSRVSGYWRACDPTGAHNIDYLHIDDARRLVYGPGAATDDGESVTGERLMALPGARQSRLAGSVEIPVCIYTPETPPLVLSWDGRRWLLWNGVWSCVQLPALPTMGHVRRLLAALGVPAGEGHADG